MKRPDVLEIGRWLLVVLAGTLCSAENENAQSISGPLGDHGSPAQFAADPVSLPEAYDLRTYGHVTSIKRQRGGTCWCHGTMAAIESNLLKTGLWQVGGDSEPPNLAEYHLDWWNGFNEHNNDDLDRATGHGLIVHQGGDYLVAAAYITRGEGAISCVIANDSNEYDDGWYERVPARRHPSYLTYYARDIEWYTAGEDLSNITTIKRAIMAHGATATCVYAHEGFCDPNLGGTAYQPPTDTNAPNHSIAIIGWDDHRRTEAPQEGAWLVKNSWGSDWNGDGYCWVSYYDKHCGQDPEMGAVSFQNVELLPYDHIYYHDYHGWRDTKTDCDATFNAFVARGTERVKSVSFYTATDDVTYTTKVYDRFEDGALRGELAAKAGHIANRGFHTIDLHAPITVRRGDDFYVYLELSAGGYAYDRTSEVKVLLDETTTAIVAGDPPAGQVGAASAREVSWFDHCRLAKMNLEGNSGVAVESASQPNQSYFLEGTTWWDLYDLDPTANFCIKALTVDVSPDFNRDKTIDLEDLTVICLFWQAGRGDEVWNEICDLNLDGVIDARDFAVLAEHWGEDLLVFAYPLAHWALDETEGVVAHDSAGHNHAELFGDPVWQPGGGIAGGALLLDGDADFIGTEFVLNSAEGPFSVFAWVKGGAPGQTIVSQLWGVNWLSADPVRGCLRTELREASHAAQPLVSGVIVADGDWHRVGVIWDGTNRILYVDDIEVATDTQPSLAQSIEGLNIGCGPDMAPGTFWTGLMDDVRIYNRAVKP